LSGKWVRVDVNYGQMIFAEKLVTAVVELRLVRVERGTTRQALHWRDGLLQARLLREKPGGRPRLVVLLEVLRVGRLIRYARLP
jgi:hypothetical protein